MDVLATGYPSIDTIASVSHSPAVGETALLRAMPDRTTFGGCGANIAVALARLGFRSGVAMIVGDDKPGDDYLRYLAAEGVDTSNVIRLPGEQTSRSFLFLNPDGQHQNFFFPGAADAWDGELTLVEPGSYRYAVVTVGPFRYNRQYIRQIRQAGVPLVWELKPDVHAYPPDMLDEFLAASAVAIMNHIEAGFVLESLGYNAVEHLLSETTHTIIVTQGAAGCRVITATGTVRVPAVQPTAVVDPTGAGDAFTAGFLAGLLRGATPETSARWGAVVASFVLEAIGCQTNLPTWEQAQARFEQHFGPFSVASSK
jgi:sugar/nucleoside kinase (ribokinase family)